MLVLQTAAYAIALWLGCYVLARRPPSRPLILTGLGLTAYAAALGVELLRGDATWLDSTYGALLVVPAVCWAAALFFLWGRGIPQRRARDLAIVTTIFFGLGCGLLLLQLPFLPRPALVLAIGADLLVFGWVVVALDAFDAGERLRIDFARSLAGAAIVVTLFGGQVALALALGAGPPAALLALLLGVIACAVALSVFWTHLQQALDHAVFGSHSPLRDQRAALLAAADALPRQPSETDPLALSHDEFAALTRRALSCVGDLPRLAASPLTRLSLVDQRLARRGASGDLLERAAELKVVLTESIARLKPPGDDTFGTSDAWRHYNALYFPYIVGLKPYSRRAAPPTGATGGAGPSTAALVWFRTSVPERTLHNWQRAAARLVALDLRQRSGELAAHGSGLPSRGSG